jgi:hypothetical protein
MCSRGARRCSERVREPLRTVVTSRHLQRTSVSGPFQGHEDIAEVDLDDCGNDTCVAFDVQLESPDVNNLFFGYAAWVSPSCCEFTLFRVAVVYTTPAGAGPAVTPNNIPKGGKAVNPKKDH